MMSSSFLPMASAGDSALAGNQTRKSSLSITDAAASGSAFPLWPPPQKETRHALLPFKVSIRESQGFHIVGPPRPREFSRGAFHIELSPACRERRRRSLLQRGIIHAARLCAGHFGSYACGHSLRSLVSIGNIHAQNPVAATYIRRLRP